MKKTRVLFLCTGNSARSQMAEAILRHYGGDHYEAFSAGTDPQGVNPLTETVLKESDISIEGLYSKNLDTYLGKKHFSYVISVCSDAEKRCPSIFPGAGKRLKWFFEDPVSAEGTADEKLNIFRQVRDQIEEQVKRWISEKDSERCSD